jgi:hypothetical protein
VIEKGTFLLVAEDERNGFLLECLHGESESVNYLNFKFNQILKNNRKHINSSNNLNNQNDFLSPNRPYRNRP